MGKKQIENPPQNPETVMWALQLCLNVGWTTVMEYVSHQRTQYYFRSLIAGMQLLKLGLMAFIYNSSDSVSNPFSKIGPFLYFLMHGSSNSRKKKTYSIFFMWIGFFRQQLFQTVSFPPCSQDQIILSAWQLSALDFVPKRHPSVLLRFQKHTCNSNSVAFLPTSSTSALPP